MINPNTEYSLATIAIAIFLFISGIFVNIENRNPEIWLFKRITRIMIPYLLVLIPIAIINQIISYKEISISQLIIQAVGGALFVKDPLMAISWFITFILGIYLISYLVMKMGKFKIVTMIVFLTIYSAILPLSSNISFLWLGLFLIGVIFSLKIKSVFEKTKTSQKIDAILFKLSEGTYPFFIVHGPILVFLINIMQYNWLISFLIGLFLSVDFSIILFKITRYLNEKIKLGLHLS